MMAKQMKYRLKTGSVFTLDEIKLYYHRTHRGSTGMDFNWWLGENIDSGWIEVIKE